jgi:hypothetical protein
MKQVTAKANGNGKLGLRLHKCEKIQLTIGKEIKEKEKKTHSQKANKKDASRARCQYCDDGVHGAWEQPRARPRGPMQRRQEERGGSGIR